MVEEKKKEPSPSQKRENALGSIAERLGNSKTQDERYNNGYAHFSLAVHSSFIRAFEQRLGLFVRNINMTIVDAVPVDTKDIKKVKSLVGKTVILEDGLFENTMTLTTWINNFYQESPSINARARDDQVQIATEGFKVPALQGFTPWGANEERLESS